MPFITIIGKSVSCGTRDNFATKISYPLCTFPVSAATFKLPIKRNRRMIEFPKSGYLRLDSRLKSGMDLIANGLVTWKFGNSKFSCF